MFGWNFNDIWHFLKCRYIFCFQAMYSCIRLQNVTILVTSSPVTLNCQKCPLSSLTPLMPCHVTEGQGNLLYQLVTRCDLRVFSLPHAMLSYLIFEHFIKLLYMIHVWISWRDICRSFPDTPRRPQMPPRCPTGAWPVHDWDEGRSFSHISEELPSRHPSHVSCPTTTTDMTDWIFKTPTDGQACRPPHRPIFIYRLGAG